MLVKDLIEKLQAANPDATIEITTTCACCDDSHWYEIAGVHIPTFNLDDGTLEGRNGPQVHIAAGDCVMF